MKIVETVAEVREQVKAWRKEGLTVGLVPTMGYLHEGHQSLIAKACAQNDRVVVSVFVNPTQFGPNEDLESYPRDLEHDAALCESTGAALIFHGRNVSQGLLQLCGYGRSHQRALWLEPSGTLPRCLHRCVQAAAYRPAGQSLFRRKRCPAAGGYPPYGAGFEYERRNRRLPYCAGK